MSIGSNGDSYRPVFNRLYLTLTVASMEHPGVGYICSSRNSPSKSSSESKKYSFPKKGNSKMLEIKQVLFADDLYPFKL